MDQARNLPELFAMLSPRVACALAWHMSCGLAPTAPTPAPALDTSDGLRSLEIAWKALTPHARQAYAQDFLRLEALGARSARPMLLAEARAAWGDAYPEVLQLLDAMTGPDLAVRLYLASPFGAQRAHLALTMQVFDEVEMFQGQYVADVIPSVDRRARMLQAMETLWYRHSDAQPRASEFVTDDRFLLALHQGAPLTTTRLFDGGHRSDPGLARPDVELLMVFRFDTPRLVIKARSAEQRRSLRDAFARIFVGDPRYFEPLEPKVQSVPCYHLPFDPTGVVTSPSLRSRKSLPRSSARSHMRT